jgi:large subunit ribosomal protein L29
MKASQMREQTTEELQDKERDLAEQLFALRLQKVTGQLEKPHRVRQVRKDLARVLTLLHERRQPGQPGQPGQSTPAVQLGQGK